MARRRSMPSLWNSPRTASSRGSQRGTPRRINHKDALRRTSNAILNERIRRELLAVFSKGVGVPLRDVWLGYRCHAPARDGRDPYAKYDSCVSTKEKPLT